MEITARPRRRRSRRALGLLLVATAVLSVALLLPAALGFSAHVVADDAMTGTHARGSLVFDEKVPLGQLAVGDVVTFVAPGGEGLLVTRRVAAIDDTGVQTRGDAAAAADPWLVPPADVGRVAFSVPLLGWPLIAVDAMSVPPWTPGVLLLGLAGLLVLMRRTPRDQGEIEDQATFPDGVRAFPGSPPLG